MRRKELSVAQLISVQLDIPTSTMSDTIKQYKETGSATPEKRPGHLKLLTQRDTTRVLQHIVHDNQFSPLASYSDPGKKCFKGL
nr:6186_t:CDS:2 [Entrophospora candida]